MCIYELATGLENFVIGILYYKLYMKSLQF